MKHSELSSYYDLFKKIVESFNSYYKNKIIFTGICAYFGGDSEDYKDIKNPFSIKDYYLSEKEIFFQLGLILSIALNNYEFEGKVIDAINKLLKPFSDIRNWNYHRDYMFINFLITNIIHKFKLNKVHIPNGTYAGWFLNRKETTIFCERSWTNNSGRFMKAGHIHIKELLIIDSLPNFNLEGGLIFAEKVVKRDGTLIFEKVAFTPDLVFIGKKGFKQFNEKELAGFSFQIYPKLDKQKEVPIQMLNLIIKYNGFESFKREYVKLFRKAQSFMQKLGLRTNNNIPNLFITYSKKYSGNYNHSLKRINLSLIPSLVDLVLFHEIMHSFLFTLFPDSEVQEKYSEKNEVLFMINGNKVKRTTKYITEGLTDFLTVHYFKNFHKEKRYGDEVVDFVSRNKGPGYYDEAKEIGKEFFKLTKELSFEEAIKKILLVKETQPSLYTKVSRRFIYLKSKDKMLKECKKIISKLNDEEVEKLIKDIKSKKYFSRSEYPDLIIFTLLNTGRIKSIITRILKNDFVTALERGVLTTNIFHARIRLNGGILNSYAEYYNSNYFLDCSNVKNGFINLTNMGYVKDLNNGVVNANTINTVSNESGIIIAREVIRVDKCGKGGLINILIGRTQLRNIKGCVILLSSSEPSEYYGQGREELLKLGEKIMKLNNDITNNVSLFKQELNEKEVDKISEELLKLNKEQLSLINKQKKIIKKNKISGVITPN